MVAPRQVALGGLREERRRGEAHLGGRIRRRDRSEIEESGEWGGSQGCKQWSSLSSFSLGARGLERIREDAPEKEPEAAPGERVGLWRGGWLSTTP